MRNVVACEWVNAQKQETKSILSLVESRCFTNELRDRLKENSSQREAEEITFCDYDRGHIISVMPELE